RLNRDRIVANYQPTMSHVSADGTTEITLENSFDPITGINTTIRSLDRPERRAPTASIEEAPLHAARDRRPVEPCRAPSGRLVRGAHEYLGATPAPRDLSTDADGLGEPERIFPALCRAGDERAHGVIVAAQLFRDGPGAPRRLVSGQMPSDLQAEETSFSR